MKTEDKVVLHEEQEVELTEEQAEVIEALREGMRSGFYSIDGILKAKHLWADKYVSCRELSDDELVRALYVGYIVEAPKFKIGDVVVLELPEGHSNYVRYHLTMYLIISLRAEGDYEVANAKGETKFLIGRYIREATELERKLFELGREKAVRKEGDKFISETGSGTVKHTLDGHPLIRTNIKQYYPVESRIELSSE